MNLPIRIPPLCAGAALATGLALVPAAPAAAQPTVLVPCTVTDLVNAFDAANTAGSGDLLLAPGCTYTPTAADSDEDGLPVITGDINLVGASTAITRSHTLGGQRGQGHRRRRWDPEQRHRDAQRHGGPEQPGGRGRRGGQPRHPQRQRRQPDQLQLGCHGRGRILNTATLGITASSIDHNSITGAGALGGLLNSGGVT